MNIFDFIFSLLVLLFLLRFLLQAANADFYNPLSQAVVKASDFICKPLRYAIPSFRNFDFASLVVAWAISVAARAVLRPELLDVIGLLLLGGLVYMLQVLTNFFMFAIFILVLASFLAQGTYNPVLTLFNQLLEPIVGPIRRVLPTFGPIDFSPMVVLIIIFLVQDVLRRFAY